MDAPPYVDGHQLLAGMTVLVTAAAGTGIGFATAKRCTEEGARVVVSDKHERRLAEAAKELDAVGIPCDVTDESSVQQLFADAVDAVGTLDVVVNNAGLMALTRCAALEAAPAGVRVNAVAPSLARHPFLNRAISNDVLDQLEQQEAFKRSAEPWEVANVIVFLASDYSSYMTGEIVS